MKGGKKLGEKCFVIKKKGNRYYVKDGLIVKDQKIARGVLNETRLKILGILSKKPMHALEIAKILGEHEQKIYYHIRQLENLGMIRIKEKSEKKGAVVKIYEVAVPSIVFDVPGHEDIFEEIETINKIKNRDKEKILSFFYPHIKNGVLDSYIVVGSPDPHGPFQVRARDGHFAGELAFFLGKFAEKENEDLIKLDVSVKSENLIEKENLILIGGVLTNNITLLLNENLPIRFDMETFPFRKIISDFTKKVYDEENVGFIIKTPNPKNKEKSIIIFAGNRYSGTKASIFAMCKKTEEILKDYSGEDIWGRVVKGLDMDGDGKIDEIEILE